LKLIGSQDIATFGKRLKNVKDRYLSESSQGARISRPRRRPRSRNRKWAVEDEDEKEDDMVAARRAALRRRVAGRWGTPALGTDPMLCRIQFGHTID